MGYLFTRVEKGALDQTRSLRINLNKFKLSSENKRILKKTESVNLSAEPIPCANYSWEIGKLGKDFYDTKFGKGTFSANKIKELMTDEKKSNFNLVMLYAMGDAVGANGRSPLPDPIGYAICRETNELIHYCYPFYHLPPTSYKLPPNTGLGMMLKAILYAQEHGKKYVYLGSAQRSTDTYKLQFEGLEWFDGKQWQTNLEELKKIL